MDKRLRSMDINWRKKFNEVVFTYDKMRPTYTKDLFDEVIKYSALDSDKNAIEVGIGTGQATLPFLQTGCKITAIEIGEDLAKFTKEKFSEYQNFNVINKDFESVEIAENTYDLFYCASAFHWIPKEIGYPKVFSVLKNGGVLALFFIRPFPISETAPIHIAMQKVYDKYMPSSSRLPKSHKFNEKDCSEIIDQIEQYGFIEAHYKLYHSTRTFNAEDYVLLINTYSDHRAMPENKRVLLENEIKEVINSFGGEFTLYDTMDLYLAKKP